MTWLLLVSWVWPLLLATLAPAARLWWLPALAALPALLATLLVPMHATLELPWLFLGTTLAMNELTQIYLGFTSLLWLVAAIYAAFVHRGEAHAGRFNLLFLLAMAGNLWLIVGQDLFSFYAGFAIMGIASYGLVIHDGQLASLRAGKVYLVMTLLGEVCLFAALVLLANQTGTTLPSAEDLTSIDGLTIALLLLGLGVKAGMVPMHVWLPLAHPAAPIPASAVLSGVMIKTAMLGWMRFLPLGALALPDWGSLLSAIGILTLLFALPLGLIQSDPKVVLAYSSISKMGLLMLILGLALIEPALAPMAVAGIAFYAANHALVKGGLFLSVGMRKHAATRPPMVQSLVLGAVIFLALALAGAPFTSGALAKYELKPILNAADWTWIGMVVAISTVGTTLLMVRFVWITARTESHPEPGYRWPGVAWGAMVGLLLMLTFALGTPSAWLTDLLIVPLALALGLLVLAAVRLRPQVLAPLLEPLIDRVPPGDILALLTPLQRRVEHWQQQLGKRWQTQRAELQQRAVDLFEQIFAAPGRDTERGLRQWPVAGSVWVGFGTLLLLFVLAGLPPVELDKADIATTPASTIDLVVEATTSLPSESRSDARRPDQIKSDIESEIGPDERTTAGIDRQPNGSASIIASGESDSEATNELDETAQAVAQARLPNVQSTSEPSAGKAAFEVGFKPDSVTEPARQAEPLAEQPLDAGEASSMSSAESIESDPASDCDPPTPYRFAPAGIMGAALELRRCDADAQPLIYPEIDAALVRRLQQALAENGYEPGPVDGIIGPRTLAAVRALQRDNGLTADGAIRFEVLDLLQSGSAAGPATSE